MEWPGPEELRRRVLSLPAVGGVVSRLGPTSEFRVAAVGGAVRDLLLGTPVEDVDLAVEGPVEPVLARLGGPARSHIRFGTATVDIAGSRVDLARTRHERYVRPGALPDVSPARLEEDLLRRDFTVNALAVPITGADAGRLLAAPHARADLENGQLRVMHPAGFIDDPTRLFRLARYQARLGFEVEAETAALARAAIAGGAVDTLSGPRIGHELKLIGQEVDPVGAWAAMAALDLDEALAPGFGIRDLGASRRALELLPPEGRPEVVLLALALAGVVPEARPSLLNQLGMPADLRKDAVLVADRGTAVAAALRQAGSGSEIAAAIGEPAPIELAAVAGALGAEEAAREWIDRLRHLRLKIGGDDLLAAGVRPGPAVGAGLAAARAALLDGRADSREQQLAEAVRAAGGAG